MILGIVGSRRRKTLMDFYIILVNILKFRPDLVVSGGCREGADWFSKIICWILGIPYKEYLPDLPPKGSPYHQFVKAYYQRNELIAIEVDKLVAQVSHDRSGGTENTIKYFLEYNEIDNLILV